MSTNENPCCGYLAKHGIQNRPVASVLNRIKPHEDTINLHEFIVNFRAKIIAVNRGFRVYAFGHKGAEQVYEPVIFSCGVYPLGVIARVKDCNRPSAIESH